MADLMCRVRVAEGGRIVIPANIRKAMGIKDGDTVALEFEAGRLSITSRREALKKVQDYIRALPSFDATRSLADELIAERRAEALRDTE